MTFKRESLTDYVKRVGITTTFTRIPARTDDTVGNWSDKARHWNARLDCGNMLMNVEYSMESDLTREPTTEDILDCFQSDLSGEPTGFEQWCEEWGYDTDSRKAYATWQAIEQEREHFRLLVGEVEYRNLLYNVEPE